MTLTHSSTRQLVEDSNHRISGGSALNTCFDPGSDRKSIEAETAEQSELTPREATAVAEQVVKLEHTAKIHVL
jgi:hypothetical protein